MVYRSYKRKIADSASEAYPYTDKHGEAAFDYLKKHRMQIIKAINITLEESSYMVNRLTRHGLTAQLESRGPASPYGQAIEYLNKFTPPTFESLMYKRGLVANNNEKNLS